MPATARYSHATVSCNTTTLDLEGQHNDSGECNNQEYGAIEDNENGGAGQEVRKSRMPRPVVAPAPPETFASMPTMKLRSRRRIEF